MIFGREPVLITGAVDAIINALIAFHVFILTGDQIAQVNIVMAAIIALVIRQIVTPTAAPVLPVGTAVTTPGGLAATVNPKPLP